MEADRRLHFWVPHWPSIPGSATELHDHRYDFTSTVLQGAVEQDVFGIGEIRRSPQEGCLELVEVDCKPGREGVPAVKGYVRPLHLVRHRVDAGQSYRLGHEAFHCAKSVGDTITLLERGPIVKDLARVLRPLGTPFTCPFSLQVSEKDCWDQMEKMVSRPM